jgi:uncharacterized membrane protein
VQQRLETDSKTKSLLKTFSWRAIATITTVGIAYFFTDNVQVALSIGTAEFVLKMFIFYIHERAWSNVK